MIAAEADFGGAGGKLHVFTAGRDDTHAHGGEVEVIGERASEMALHFEGIAFFLDVIDDDLDVWHRTLEHLAHAEPASLVKGRTTD